MQDLTFNGTLFADDTVVELPHIAPSSSAQTAYAQKSSALAIVDISGVPGLTPEARKVFSAVPDSVCPVQTAYKYPRVLNRLAEVWTRPAMRLAYMNSLLVSDRPSREGFPVEVGVELFRLSGYLNELD